MFLVRQPTGSLQCCGREGWRGHQVQSPASKQSSPPRHSEGSYGLALGGKCLDRPRH